MKWDSRKRIEAAFNHQETDRTPIFEYILLGARAEDILGSVFHDYTGNMQSWLSFAEQLGFEEALRKYSRDRIEMASFLEHDMLFICPNPLPGSPYVYDPLSNVDEQFDLKNLSDPVERLKERTVMVEQELDKPLPTDCYLVYSYLREEMEQQGIDLPIFAPAYFHGIWNDIDLMQTLLLDPDTAKHHFTIATRRAISIIDDYLEYGIEMIGIGGDFAGQAPLISPAAYREFIVPEVRILADRSVSPEPGLSMPLMETSGRLLMIFLQDVQPMGIWK